MAANSNHRVAFNAPYHATSELDCGNRKRPLDLFEDSENSPKRHNMEDENELSHQSAEQPSQQQQSVQESLDATQSYLHDPNDDNKYQLKMTIPSYAAGCIIGKAGTTIVETQKNYHAVIKLSKANENYPFTKERVVLIVGSMKALQLSGRFIQEKIREAVDLFGPKLTDESPPAEQRANMAKVLIPHSTVGMLIGRQGATQKQIQTETGVKMEISPKPDFSPIMERCVTLTGMPNQLNAALDKVLVKIKADPQSGSCPNLVYNIVGAAGLGAAGLMAAGLGGGLGMMDPSYDLLKLYATNPYAAAALAPSFAYPNAYLSPGAFQPATSLAQGGLDQQTAAIYAAMGLSAFPTQQHIFTGQPTSYLPQTSMAASQAQQSRPTAAGSLGKDANAAALASLAGNPIFNAANLNQQSQLLANVGLMAGNVNTSQASANPSFLANNSSGAALSALQTAQGAAGVYYSSLPQHTDQSSLSAAAVQNLMNSSQLAHQPNLINGALQSYGDSSVPSSDSSAGSGVQLIDVADNIIGALLGLGGRTLIEIQNLTATRIQISPKGDPSPDVRRLSIVGSPQSVLSAKALIEQRIRMTENLRAQQGKITV